jgi:ABC-2 type transport system ATP-binding protein
MTFVTATFDRAALPAVGPIRQCSGMAAITVHELHKSYARFEAVRGVSFEVAEGEVFCLLGPNGAGKTTTVEILEGYRRATSGTVAVLGHDPATAEPAMYERVGIVLQECGVQDDLTVGELLAMYRSYYPRPRPLDEVVELVELDAKRDALARTLSGGQRRRLDLALALVGDPDLIFLDEPTTGFDPSARRSAWSTIRALCSLGKTVVLTTHFMDEAQELADRVAVMVGGQIVAAGTPSDLGGRDRAPAQIRFELPAGVGLADLPDLALARVSRTPTGVLVVTDQPLATAHRLTGWALERGHELTGFAVSQPTLEDIYLALTTTEVGR